MSNPYRAPEARGSVSDRGFQVVQFVGGVLLGGALDIGIPVVGWLVLLVLSGVLSDVTPPDALLAVVGMAFLGIGVTQVLWNGPVALLLWWRGLRSMALGVITAMAILFLLNAACWGLLGMAMVGA